MKFIRNLILSTSLLFVFSFPAFPNSDFDNENTIQTRSQIKEKSATITNYIFSSLVSYYGSAYFTGLAMRKVPEIIYQTVYHYVLTHGYQAPNGFIWIPIKLGLKINADVQANAAVSTLMPWVTSTTQYGGFALVMIGSQLAIKVGCWFYTFSSDRSFNPLTIVNDILVPESLRGDLESCNALSPF